MKTMTYKFESADEFSALEQDLNLDCWKIRCYDIFSLQGLVPSNTAEIILLPCLLIIIIIIILVITIIIIKMITMITMIIMITTLSSS